MFDTNYSLLISSLKSCRVVMIIIVIYDERHKLWLLVWDDFLWTKMIIWFIQKILNQIFAWMNWNSISLWMFVTKKVSFLQKKEEEEEDDDEGGTLVKSRQFIDEDGMDFIQSIQSSKAVNNSLNGFNGLNLMFKNEFFGHFCGWKKKKKTSSQKDEQNLK